MKKNLLFAALLMFCSNFLFGQNVYLPFTDDGVGKQQENIIPDRTIEPTRSGVTVSYYFDGSFVAEKSVNETDYQIIQIKGFSPIGQVGAPGVPSRADLIAMPIGATPKITILSVKYIDYEGYMLHPSLKPARDTEGAPEPEFERNETIYSTDAFFPSEIVETVEIQKMRETPIAMVQICPVQYNPVTKTLRVYSEIKYGVSFSGGKSSFDYLASDNSKHFTDILKSSVINPSYIPDGKERDHSTKSGKDYIIISHSEYESAANDLAQWKRQLGYSVEVVSASSWSATEVKDAIHTRYANWTPKPDYFVIIGDHDGSYAVPGEIYYDPSDNKPFATDLYYACMDGTGDYIPDMAHGRISVSSLSEANVVIQKIINYEKTPPTQASYYTNGLTCAQYQDDNNNGYADRRFLQTAENVKDYLSDEQGYAMSRIYYSNTSADVTTLRYNNDNYSTGELLPAELRDAGFNWSGGASDITSAINAGKFMVLHRDHGYVGGSGWAHPYYTTSSMTSLSNGENLPVVFSINCHTGEFRLSNCFAEKILRMENKGAVGVVGAAYYSYSGHNDGIVAGMFDAIWPDPGLTFEFGDGGVSNPPASSPPAAIYTMGDVVNQGLIRMMETWAYWSSSFEYTHQLFHYFGDPTMKIWTANPNSSVIAATHSSSIDYTENSFSITGSTTNALATLVYEGRILGQVVLDGSGEGTISYSITNNTGDVVLTVSNYNSKPYTSNLTITGSGNFLPEVATSDAGSVTGESAVLNGEIVDANSGTVSESGFVYSTTIDPVIDGVGVTKITTSPLVGSGTFDLTATGLLGNSKYYFRAFATTESGTGYGETYWFTTLCGTALLPFTEDFEGTFLPDCWSIDNSDGNKTWERNTSASGNGGSTAAAYVECVSYSARGQTDALITPNINLTSVFAASLEFNVAHRRYSSSYSETLNVLVSTNDGTDWTSVYTKSGTDLATGDYQTGDFTPSVASDWRLETVDLTTYAGQTVMLKFELTNDYGNNIYIDDIEVTGSVPVSEPTNYVTSTSSSSATSSSLQINWTDAVVGSQVPDAYLVKLSTGTVADPEDGTFEADGALVKNVAHGSKGGATFTGLDPATTYNYKIYSYTNSGTAVDFKLDGTIPSGSQATKATPVITVSETTLNFNNVYAGGSSFPELYTVEGSDLTADITITAPAEYEVSTSCSSGYGSLVTLTQSGGSVSQTTVYLRFSPSGISSYAGDVTHESTGATTKNIAVNETNSASNVGTYYDAISGSGRTLLWNLHAKVKAHTKRSYANLWTDMVITDSRANGTVWDMYSDKVCDSDTYQYNFGAPDQDNGTGGGEEDSKYNREHSFPKSWWAATPTEGDTMYTDLFHLVPTDKYVNNQRSNWELGVVSSPSATYMNGSKLGPNSYSGAPTTTAFEPIDEYKGDFARAYLYMAVRYAEDIPNWITHCDMMDGDYNDADGSVYEEWALNMLIAWHNADPVDQKERNRNDAIYGIQGNRNPFIDHPEYVASIWTPVINPEPTNYVTSTSSSSATSSSLQINWTDAVVGSQVPDAYLVKLSTGTVAAPEDGTFEADGALVKNVAHGSKGGATFTGLDPATTYNYKIYSYTNSGANVDFKLDGTVPSGSQATKAGGGGCASDLIISQVNENGNDKYVEIANFTGASVSLANYEISVYANGASTPNYTIELSNGASIADGDVWIFAYKHESLTADQISASFLPNGNDVIALVKSGTNIDVFGTIGNSTAWYENKTCIRNADITDPTTTYSTSDWAITAYSGGDPTTLGAHTMTCSSNDTDTEVYASGSPISGSTISSVAGAYTDVFKFIIQDQNSGDGLNTIVTGVRIWKHTSNTADWTDAIQAVKLNDGSEITLGTVSITDDYIDIAIPSGNLEALDNSTEKTVTLSILLNTTNIVDNSVLSFFIDADAHNFTADNTGSDFASELFEGDFNSGDFTVDIEATKLLFTTNKPPAIASTSADFDVEVKATDANGNVDADAINSVTLAKASGSGTLSSATGLTKNLASGVYAWTDAQLDAADTYTITASATGLTSVTSGNIVVSDAPSIVITEFAGYGQDGDADDEYIELTNTGSSSVDLTNWTLEYYDDGGLEATVNLIGSVAAGEDYMIAARSTHTGAISPDVEASGMFMNSTGYVILKDGSSAIIDQAGSSTDKFSDGKNYEFTDCGADNLAVSSWTDLGTGNGTPNAVNCANSNDATSTVADGGGTEPTTISSLVDADGEEIAVFDFTFTDAASGDGLATILDQIQISQGSANAVADWTNAIAGAYLSGTDLGSALSGTINATDITFASDDMISIADGTNETYTLKIYLKTDLSAISDNDVLEFKLEFNDITADNAGSSFVSGAPESGDANVKVDIEATKLLFVQQPSATVVDIAMSPNPTVKACDANGNIDTDYSTAVSVSSDGTMNPTSVSGSWTNGVATFASLTHTVIESGRTLTAASTGITSAVSSTFDITLVTYCAIGFPSPAGADDDAITNVTFNGDGNSSGDSNNPGTGYEDYTGTVLTNVAQGLSYDIYVTVNTNGDFLYNVWAWFDWNQDGDFDDAGEAYDMGAAVFGTAITKTVSVTVPAGATLGNTRLRVVFMNAEYDTEDPIPCNPQDVPDSDYGEAEDYTINVIEPNDATSTVTASATLTEPTTISSLVDADGEEIAVFDFTFTDAASGDTKATILDQIQITQGSANAVADWTNAIAGAYLSGTDLGSALSGTINATDITFASDDMISIADGTNETYTLKIYLKTDLSAISDNDVLEFKLEFNDITADNAGSSFVSGAPESGDANVKVDIEATKLLFTTNKPPAIASTSADFDVEVKATDANGNVDADAINSVTLAKASGSGTLSSATGLTKNLASGVYAWTDAQLDAADTYTITASATGLTSVTSGNIVVSDCIPANDGEGTAIIGNGATNELLDTDVWQRNQTSQVFKATVTGVANCLESVSVDLSIAFTGLDVNNVTLSGAAASEATKSVAGQVLTIDNLYLTDVSTLSVEITDLSTIDISVGADIGQKTITVETANNGGTLTAIASSPTAYITVPFENAKALTGDVLDNNGEIVALEGISTIASGKLRLSTSSYDQFFIQQGDGAGAKGICIRKSSAFSPVRAIAKTYIVKGELDLIFGSTTGQTDAYACMTAINTPSLIADLGAATLPTPYIIKIDDGASSGIYTMTDADFEEYDGLLMRIQSIRKESGDSWPSDDGSLDIYDNNVSNTIRCYIFSLTDIGGTTEPDWASGDVDMVTLVYNYNTGGTGVDDRQITPVYYDNFFEAIVWDNTTGNGLWSEAQNWSPNILPQEVDDVVLQNTTAQPNSYDVTFDVASTSVNSLTITPDADKVITFTISNTAIPAITLQADAALTINDGGVFVNASGAASGNVIALTGTTPVVLINNGGHYIHRTASNYTNLLDVLSSVAGTETGIFEFDAPTAGSYTIDLSGRTFGALVLNGANGTPTYDLSGSSDLTIRDAFTVGTNASVNEGTYSGNLLVAGNFINNATAWTFNTGQTLTFNGTVLQTVSGTYADNFDKNVVVANTAGVAIDNLFIVNNGGTAPNFTINASCHVSVNPNAGLTVGGTFTNNGSIRLESPENSGASGSLITKESGATIAGTAVVERFIPFNEFHYVSSPISNATDALFTDGANAFNSNFFSYDETFDADPDPTAASYEQWSLFANAWQHAHNGDGGADVPLTVGKGYATFDNGYKTVEFSGTINNDDFNIPVTRTENEGAFKNYFDGWNMIGNPYPSALDWTHASWDKTNIENTVYFYEQSYPGGYDYYWYYNHTGGTQGDLSGITLNSATTTPNIIPASQGFMVKAKASGDVTIPNAARVHSEQIFWKNQTLKSPENMLKLRVSANGFTDEMAVRFAEGATTEHDADFDAYKMYSGNMSIPQIYSITENSITHAINTLPLNNNDKIIPLGVRIGNATSATIEAVELTVEGIKPVWLEDLQLNQLIDLRTTPSYTFSFAGGDVQNRFRLHFNKLTTGLQTADLENNVNIYSSGSDIYVDLGDEIKNQATIIIYNAIGQVITIRKTSDTFNKLTPNVHSGIYIVKTIQGEKVSTKQVFVNR